VPAFWREAKVLVASVKTDEERGLAVAGINSAPQNGTAFETLKFGPVVSQYASFSFLMRLALVREQISSIEKTHAERLERAPDAGPHAMVRLTLAARDGDTNRRSGRKHARGVGRTRE
jgi:hypothetical protein